MRSLFPKEKDLGGQNLQKEMHNFFLLPEVISGDYTDT